MIYKTNLKPKLVYITVRIVYVVAYFGPGNAPVPTHHQTQYRIRKPHTPKTMTATQPVCIPNPEQDKLCVPSDTSWHLLSASHSSLIPYWPESPLQTHEQETHHQTQYRMRNHTLPQPWQPASLHPQMKGHCTHTQEERHSLHNHHSTATCTAPPWPQPLPQSIDILLSMHKVITSGLWFHNRQARLINN